MNTPAWGGVNRSRRSAILPSQRVHSNRNWKYQLKTKQTLLQNNLNCFITCDTQCICNTHKAHKKKLAAQMWLMIMRYMRHAIYIFAVWEHLVAMHRHNNVFTVHVASRRATNQQVHVIFQIANTLRTTEENKNFTY